ncbi:MAG: hypothetical protein AAFV87_16720 [Pseudomonadota bacterium]
MMPRRISALILGLAGLAGCETIEGTRAYSGPDSVIATGQDQGQDVGFLDAGVAAIAYTPDGCQVWIIDDGVEGYASERVNRHSGLPVCDDDHPPGTVIGDYDSGSQGIDDRVSGPAR